MEQQKLRTELLELGFEEDQNKNGVAGQDLSQVDLLGCLTPEQLLGMVPNQQPQQQRNPSQKMEIDVKNMTYPMGDDTDDTYYKMVFLVRMDLKMGTGKIAAQTGHAVLGAYQQMEEHLDNPENEKILDGWEECGCPKIVLKVESKEQLLDLEKKAVDAGLNTYVVCDAGRTQVEPGSMTVCAIGPANADSIDAITKHLKLLN